MKEYDYAAVLEAMLTLEVTTFSQYTDAAYQYERVLHKHFDTIRHALRFAEKMMSIPSTKMCDAGSEQFPTIANGEEYAAETIFKSMRDAALKELGE